MADVLQSPVVQLHHTFDASDYHASKSSLDDEVNTCVDSDGISLAPSDRVNVVSEEHNPERTLRISTHKDYDLESRTRNFNTARPRAPTGEEHGDSSHGSDTQDHLDRGVSEGLCYRTHGSDQLSYEGEHPLNSTIRYNAVPPDPQEPLERDRHGDSPCSNSTLRRAPVFEQQPLKRPGSKQSNRGAPSRDYRSPSVASHKVRTAAGGGGGDPKGSKGYSGAWVKRRNSSQSAENTASTKSEGSKAQSGGNKKSASEDSEKCPKCRGKRRIADGSKYETPAFIYQKQKACPRCSKSSTRKTGEDIKEPGDEE